MDHLVTIREHETVHLGLDVLVLDALHALDTGDPATVRPSSSTVCKTVGRTAPFPRGAGISIEATLPHSQTKPHPPELQDVLDAELEKLTRKRLKSKSARASRGSRASNSSP
jgi:hypothetical protein